MKRSREFRHVSPLGELLWLPLLLGTVIVLALFWAITLRDTAQAGREADEILTSVRAYVLRYDNSMVDSKTKSLVRLLDKANELSRCLALHDLDSREKLDEYAWEQRLTGAAVLDEHMDLLLDTSEEAEVQVLFREIVSSEVVRSIAAHPRKSYMARLELDGQVYDFAAVSRRDDPGVVVAYMRRTTVVTDETLSLGSLFEDLSFTMDATVAVANDDVVLATNSEQMKGLSNQACMDWITGGSLTPDRSGLIRARGLNGSWYGKAGQAGSYRLYVFFPARAVFTTRRLLMGYVLAGYGLVWLAYAALRQRTVRRNLHLAREQQARLHRAAEEAERANAVKTDFLRRISHDVRTPINGIRGMVEISRACPGDEARQEECREKILAASGYLLELVNSLLDMGDLESGTVRLEERPFDLTELLHQVGALAELQAKEAGVEYRTSPAAVTHTALIGSPLHLRQILQNIAGNAVRYNRAGGLVEVSVRETAWDGERAEFEFVCADTGIGMSEEFQGRAFEPFAQENASPRTEYPGVGLGLAITRELAGQMGGSVRFVSRRGEGTTFTVRLPFRIDPGGPRPAPPEPALPASAAPLRGRTVLAAEDNELNLEIAQFLLESRGARVLCARDGQEAADRFAASAPGEVDAILMDLMMPRLGGLEAARLIRTMDRPDAGTVPILAMTADAFAEDRARSLAAGMNGHLVKPLDGDDLVRALLEAWERQKA